jgi:hypothetical protein
MCQPTYQLANLFYEFGTLGAEFDKVRLTPMPLPPTRCG